MTDTFEQGELDVSIFDLQARFNINNLVGGTEEDNNRARQQFGRLLENLSIEPKAIEALLNWDDVHTVPDADTSGGSAPTAEQTHSWSSTNWLITHLSELYSLDGIDRENGRQIDALPERPAAACSRQRRQRARTGRASRDRHGRNDKEPLLHGVRKVHICRSNPVPDDRIIPSSGNRPGTDALT